MQPFSAEDCQKWYKCTDDFNYFLAICTTVYLRIRSWIRNRSWIQIRNCLEIFYLDTYTINKDPQKFTITRRLIDAKDHNIDICDKWYLATFKIPYYFEMSSKSKHRYICRVFAITLIANKVKKISTLISLYASKLYNICLLNCSRLFAALIK